MGNRGSPDTGEVDGLFSPEHPGRISIKKPGDFPCGRSRRYAAGQGRSLESAAASAQARVPRRHRNVKNGYRVSLSCRPAPMITPATRRNGIKPPKAGGRAILAAAGWARKASDTLRPFSVTRIFYGVRTTVVVLVAGAI